MSFEFVKPDPSLVHTGKVVDDMIDKIMAKRYEILEHFSQAYLAETGLKPSEVELIEGVEDRGGGGIHTVWRFRKIGEIR